MAEVNLNQLAERNRRSIRFDALTIALGSAFTVFTWFTLDGVTRTVFTSIYVALLIAMSIILVLNIRLRRRIADLREQVETIDALNRWFRF